METGRVKFADTAKILQENPAVQQAYLGIS